MELTKNTHNTHHTQKNGNNWKANRYVHRYSATDCDNKEMTLISFAKHFHIIIV